MKNMRKVLSLVMGLIMLLSPALCCAEGAESGLQKDLVILFTSDVHCGVDQGFGYAGLQAVRDTMEAAGNHVMLVDDGDSIQGEALGMITQGQADIEMMNALKYDLAIPGNHEFDYSMERFMELTKMAQFPYISCNFTLEGELVFDPWKIFEVDGVKIGFVGVTTPETLTSSTPRHFQDTKGNYIYGFMQGNDGKDLYAAVQKAVDEVRAEGAEYVILVAHLGLDAACIPYTYADVVANTTGVDVVLDGHSHDTEKVVMKNLEGKDVIRQACGTKMQCIGWLRISAKDGSCDTGLYIWNNDISAPDLLGIDNELNTLVKETTGKIDADLASPVGFSDVDLVIYDPTAVDGSGNAIRIVRRAETNLGDLAADAFRAASGAEICLVSGGSFRKNLSKGDIIEKDVMNVLPFGNKLLMVEATGQQILDALEIGTVGIPEENGAFMHVSGLTYEIHTYIESTVTTDEHGLFAGVTGDYRVRNVLVNGEPLDPEKTYTLVGMDYILKLHGNGVNCFDECKVLWNGSLLDYQTIIEYIRNDLGGVIGTEYANPYGDGRIVAVEEAPAE